jgi:FkbM family methyltransferase
VIASVDIETINAMKENISKVASPFIVTGEFATAAFDIYELKKLKQIRDSLEFGTDIFDLVVAARQSNDFQAVNDYFKESIIEKRIQYLAGPELNSCDVIIDGGTFGGQEAMLFAKKAPKGKVYTFDPWGGEQISDRVNFDLQRNLEIVQKALWNKSANLYFNANPIGMHAAGAFVSETQDGDLPCIKGISIDDFVKEKKLPEINFIKMDIEGSEVEAIKGASETISKFKPKLAICVYHRPEHFYEIADLVLEFNPTYKMGFGHYSPHLDESVMYFY